MKQLIIFILLALTIQVQAQQSSYEDTFGRFLQKNDWLIVKSSNKNDLMFFQVRRVDNSLIFRTCPKYSDVTEQNLGRPVRKIVCSPGFKIKGVKSANLKFDPNTNTFVGKIPGLIWGGQKVILKVNLEQKLEVSIDGKKYLPSSADGMNYI